MILIVGGFAAGKRRFATSLGYGEHDVYMLRDAHVSFDSLCKYKVILAQEMGCGLVPMEAETRQKREEMGRLCCSLATEATAVYRVICGIGTQIK